MLHNRCACVCVPDCVFACTYVCFTYLVFFARVGLCPCLAPRGVWNTRLTGPNGWAHGCSNTHMREISHCLLKPLITSPPPSQPPPYTTLPPQPPETAGEGGRTAGEGGPGSGGAYGKRRGIFFSLSVRMLILFLC